MTLEQEIREAEARAEARGENKKAVAIAKKMLHKGSDVESIIELTELTLEQIQAIADKIGIKL